MTTVDNTIVQLKFSKEVELKCSHTHIRRYRCEVTDNELHGGTPPTMYSYIKSSCCTPQKYYNLICQLYINKTGKKIHPLYKKGEKCASYIEGPHRIAIKLNLRLAA